MNEPEEQTQAEDRMLAEDLACPVEIQPGVDHATGRTGRTVKNSTVSPATEPSATSNAFLRSTGRDMGGCKLALFMNREGQGRGE